MSKKMPVIEGEKYGRLTILKEIDPYVSPSGKSKARKVLCVCDCGREKNVTLSSLRRGVTRSCGCLFNEMIIEKNKDNAKYNGYSNHPHFSRWRGMMERCYYPKHKDYSTYGGNGITVCKEWREHPKNFIKWIEEESNWAEGQGLTLDRVDYNGDYEPSNCKFSTHTEQALNRRISKINTSGYPGVGHFGGKWRARINKDGVRRSLGVFESKNAALEARRAAEMEIYGKYLHDVEN